MEERALIAIVISIAIIILYQYFFVSKNIKKNEQLKKGEEINREIVETENEEKINPIEKQKEILINDKISEIIKLQKKREKRDYLIETKKYILKYTNHGGKIISFKLKDYYEKKKEETWPLKIDFWRYISYSYKKFFNFKEEKEKRDEFVEIIHEKNEKNNFSLILKSIQEDDYNDNISEGLYEVNEEEYTDVNKNIIKKVRMNFINNKGIFSEKEVLFYENDYKIHINIRLKNMSETKQNINYALIWGPGIGKEENKSTHHKFIGPSIYINGKKERIKPKKINNKFEKEGYIDWIAIENTYFSAAILPIKKLSIGLIYKQKENNNETISIGIRYPGIYLDSGEEIKNSYILYIGPKRKEDLAIISSNLKEIIDYGWFSFLAKPMIWLLNTVYKAIPNYGFAIIILTIIIKIIFWPLTEKSFNSMKQMEKIQPKMATIRQKYKDDPTKMNKEIMDLYKTQGVNPFGGCLPMVLQIPVFFALYEGLLVAIEMRDAPFIFWIKDLSAMDPLLITPILMGITMYIQQRMMPTGMDPKQAKMMNIMPIFFTIFFLGFPSGLVIYWLLNNVLTIGHQYLLLRKTKEH